MKRAAILLVAILMTVITAACDGGGGGGGGIINPTRILVVTRVTAISDDGTDSLGSISTLMAAPTLTYTVTNGGTQPLTFAGSTPWVSVNSQVNVTGLVVTQPPSSTVAPSGMVTFAVDYTVAGNGAFSFTINFGTDATSGQTGPTFSIFVDGTGDNSTRILAVSRSGAITDGGSDAVGNVPAGVAAPTLTYTLTNTGTGAMLLTGASPWVNVLPIPAPVNVTGTPAITQPATATIAAGGGSVTFDVDYVVTGTGAYSFTLVFGTDASSGQTGPTFEINVSGTGVAPTRVIEVSRSGAIADAGADPQGNVNATVAAPTLTYTITNTGNSDLTLAGGSPWVTVAAAPAPVNISGSPAITQPSGAVVAANGGTVTFDVDYTVTGAGAFSFTVTFGSDATSGQTGGTFEFQISGTGVVANRPIQVKRSLITLTDGGTDSLGRRPFGVSGGFIEYQVNNTGTDPLTLSGGPNFVTTSSTVNLSGGLTVTQPSSGTINGGASDTFRIDFTVAAAGAFSFAVSMTTDATAGQTGPAFNFTVSGTGGVELAFSAIENTPPPTVYEPYTNMAASGATRTRVVTAGIAPQTLQSAAVPSPNGAYVAFEMQDVTASPTVRNIYVAPSAGGVAVQVSPTPVTADDRYSLEPVWAPVTGATQYLMFRGDNTAPAQGAYELFTAQVSGTGASPAVSNLTKVGGWGTASTTRRLLYGFKWRQDGAAIAFVINENAATGDEIWAANFTGGLPGTAGRVDGTGGSWANTDPEFIDFFWAGTSVIVFRVDDAVALQQHRLWAVAVNMTGTPSGGTRVLQTDNIGAADAVPQQPQGWGVSTDGTRLAWIRNGAGTDHVHATVVNTVSAPASQQIDNIAGAIANADVTEIAWSPSGDSIAYTIDALVDTQFDVYIQKFTTVTGAMVASGTEMKISNVTTNEGAGGMRYAPEGMRIMYKVYNGVSGVTRLEVADVAASPTRVNVAAGLTNAAAGIAQIAWRPGDGAAVIFMADGDTAGTYEGYCVPLYGPLGVTAGTRFKFSGAVFAGYGISNINWIK